MGGFFFTISFFGTVEKLGMITTHKIETCLVTFTVSLMPPNKQTVSGAPVQHTQIWVPSMVLGTHGTPYQVANWSFSQNITKQTSISIVGSILSLINLRGAF